LISETTTTAEFLDGNRGELAQHWDGGRDPPRSQPMAHFPPYKSDAKTLNPGSNLDFFDFVPLRGPTGGRVVVDKFILRITGVITVATALWDGRDVCRLAQLIVLEQRDGKQRWNLSGYKSRIASIRYNGIEEHDEHGNVAIGAGQAIDFALIIPMRKPKLRRLRDFAIPADVFRKISISWASLAQAATGTTVLSANTLVAYVLADFHEETKVEFKAEDVVKSVDFNSNTQAKISCVGAIHDMDVVLENTTAGGAVVTAITDARVEDLNVPLLTFSDYRKIYSQRRMLAPSGPITPATERFLEPVRENKCLPIIVSDIDTSLWDGKVVPTVKVDVGTGVAGLSIITREVTEKSLANYQAQAAAFNVDHTKVKMAMADTDPSRVQLGTGWNKRQQLVGVWSAALPQAH